MLAKDAMLSYPNFSEEIIARADTSAIQLGGLIAQNKKSLAFLAKIINRSMRMCYNRTRITIYGRIA